MQAEATVNYSLTRTRILNILTAITIVTMLAAILMALFYAGTDQQQGNVQRIFYMHVGGFTGGATAFFITVIAGIAYLRTHNPKWDRLALASVEMGLPLMTVTLLPGSIWARPIWNTWWASDDPRLNSTAVMWVVGAPYLPLRAPIVKPERPAPYASGYC